MHFESRPDGLYRPRLLLATMIASDALLGHLLFTFYWIGCHNRTSGGIAFWGSRIPIEPLLIDFSFLWCSEKLKRARNV